MCDKKQCAGVMQKVYKNVVQLNTHFLYGSNLKKKLLSQAIKYDRAQPYLIDSMRPLLRGLRSIKQFFQQIVHDIVTSSLCQIVHDIVTSSPIYFDPRKVPLETPSRD